MDFPAIIQAIAASGHEIREIGVPTVFLLFNLWLLHQERQRSDARLAQEQKRVEVEENRTAAERSRLEELQGKLFALANASIEQSLKTEAAVMNLARELHSGQPQKPSV